MIVIVMVAVDYRAKHDVPHEEGGGVGGRGEGGRGHSSTPRKDGGGKCELSGAPTNSTTANSSGSANKQGATDMPPINLTSTKVMRVLLSSWA